MSIVTEYAALKPWQWKISKFLITCHLLFYLIELVLEKNSTYNFRYNNILQIPQVRTSKFGKNSLRYAAAIINRTASADIGKFRGIRPWMYIEDHL